jgi:hypothetical protein
MTLVSASRAALVAVAARPETRGVRRLAEDVVDLASNTMK